MFTLILSFAVSALVVTVFKYLNATRKPPILGIYQQRNKGYWLKLIFMYILLTVKRVCINIYMFYMTVRFHCRKIFSENVESNVFTSVTTVDTNIRINMTYQRNL